MRRVPRWMLIGVLTVMLGTPAVWAHERHERRAGEDEIDALMSRYNLHPMFHKLGRGVSNTLGGWMEVPLNIRKRQTDTDTAGSYFAGAGIGAFKGLIRTAVGLYEVVTSFVPLPEDYATILPTLEYYQKTPKRAPLRLE